jgi:hypothetical protein
VSGAFRKEATPGAVIERVKAASLWEIFFSLNLGCTVVCVMFALSLATLAFFSRLESRIKISLHIRQTDFVVGHFAVWVPTVATALLIWIILRRFANARFTGEFVRWAAGTITVFTPAVSPICYSIASSWPEGWRIGALLCEMIVAISLVWWFQSGESKTSPAAPALLLATHFAFWLYVPILGLGGSGELNSDGIVSLILGFCAAVAWCQYVGWLKRVI